MRASLMMSNQELIAKAAAVLNPHLVKERRFGDVGAALLSGAGYVYTGVSVDTQSWGLCAERSAMAAMITAGEYTFLKVVAVWTDPSSGTMYVLPPCGVCREFMRNVDERNLQPQIVLGNRKVTVLRDLLPLHEWPQPLKAE